MQVTAHVRGAAVNTDKGGETGIFKSEGLK